VPVSLAPKGFLEQVSPSHLFPDLQGDRGVVAREGGERRILLDRMRLIVREDGSLERAAERLPPGSVTSVALPSRLGGGFLFHANTGGGTQIWRAERWLSKLKPLVQLSSIASDILPGFDRLYVRFQNSSRLSALSLETGEPMSLGPLPIATSYGQLAFADGWRAVVDTDLRGPLATFDAGTTWRPVDLGERATAVGIVNGDPAVFVAGGRYQIDAHGLVTYRSDTLKERASADAEELPAPVRQPGPFGKRPLRTALEDGWPDSATTAVVARGGALARISLDNGAILATTDEAYPDRRAACHGIRLGQGFGFVCGERDSATTIYDFVPPLGMRPIMRFARPRFVAPSGNGALVIRGSCTDEGEAAAESRSYCVRSIKGSTREIRVKGDLGVERVIALADDRVAVLVPPRGGSSGQLTLLDGSSASSVVLTLPTEPKAVARELRRGMWLDGYEEREKGVISGWIEAGGPVVGLRITLDGKVTAGPLREDSGGALLAGRFGLSLGDNGRAAETTDGGQHWETFDLPERDEEPSRANNTRACGPVGCALGSWLRVGWGRPAAPDDLRPVDAPTAPYLPLKVPQTLWFNCELGAPAASPPPAAAKGPTTAKAAPGPIRGGVIGVLHGAAHPTAQGPVTPSGWNPFRGVAGPTLSNDEIGFDHGPYADTVLMRAYAWGKRGADWTRNGRWLIRFDDRFDTAGGVRSSAATAALWPDESSTGDAIGNGSYGSVNWVAFLDPSGNAVLANACRGATCAYYSVGDGQPVLPVRDQTGRNNTLSRPFAGGAVRVGETWFFLTQGASYDVVVLYRVDLGVARALGTYYRPARYGMDAPRLVRRALGGALGILVGSGPEPGERVGMWYVLPVDPESGALGEATPLVRRDYAGVLFDRCAPGQDGWLFESTFDSPAAVQLTTPGGYASFESLELRGRMDPGTVCVDRLASRVDGLSSFGKAKPGAPPPPRPIAVAPMDEASAIPLASTERGTGKRWALQCQFKRPWLFKR
jgi:hypothetical protein